MQPIDGTANAQNIGSQKHMQMNCAVRCETNGKSTSEHQKPDQKNASRVAFGKLKDFRTRGYSASNRFNSEKNIRDPIKFYAPPGGSSIGGHFVQVQTPLETCMSGGPSAEYQIEASIDVRVESDESELMSLHTYKGVQHLGTGERPFTRHYERPSVPRLRCVNLRCSCMLTTILIVLLAFLVAASILHRQHRSECDNTLQKFMDQFCNVSLPPMRLTEAAISSTNAHGFNLNVIRTLACSQWPSNTEHLFKRMTFNLTTEFLKPYGLATNISETFVRVIEAQSLGGDFVIDFREDWAQKVLFITKCALEHGDYGSALSQSYEAAVNASSSKDELISQPKYFWAGRELLMYRCFPELSREPQANPAFVDYQGSPYDLYWSISLSRYCKCAPKHNEDGAGSEHVLGLVRHIALHIQTCY